MSKSSNNFRIWFIIAIVFFVLLIILPDIFYWAFLSNFQEPLRTDIGAYTPYLVWLNDIFQKRFSDNPYFWEHSGGKERFLLFQSIMRLIPQASRIPMGWWHVILKGASAFALFIGIYFLFKNFGRKQWESLGLTAFFVFFYGPLQLLEPGLSSWFLIFFIVGIILLFKTPQFSKFWHQVIIIGVANTLFIVHPVSFSLGVLIGGLWFLWFSVFNRNWRYWALLGLWVAFSILNVVVFYNAYISGLGQVNSVHESLERMGVRFGRLPILPLAGLRLLGAALALAALARVLFKKFSGESHLFQTLLFLGISFFSLFLAINSNIVTGFAVVSDHYLILEDFFTIILLGFAFFELLPEMNRSKFRSLAVIFSVILGLHIVALFYGRPWRSWLVVGISVPLVTGYALLVWRLWGASVPALYLKKFAIFFIAIAAIFGALFSWRLHGHDFSFPKTDERDRPLITALRTLEPGVVLAPPGFANVITVYTNHKVYWGDGGAYKFSGGDEVEFKKRWLDIARFYPESADLTASDCAGAAGNGGFRSALFSGFEKAIVRAFFPLWYNRLYVIPEAKFDAACAALKQELKNMPLNFSWQPAYRIDYAVFEKGKSGVPPLVARDFIFLKNTGEFSIYKFKQK